MDKLLSIHGFGGEGDKYNKREDEEALYHIPDAGECGNRLGLTPSARRLEVSGNQELTADCYTENQVSG